MASFSVRLPDETGRTSAPSSCIRNTLRAWRFTSTSPMYTTHSRPNSAQAVAVGTPCWPARVSAVARRLRPPRRGDEGPQLAGILAPRRRLDPGGHVDAPGVHLVDRLADVLGRQPAGQQEPGAVGHPFGQSPVEDPAGAG